MGNFYAGQISFDPFDYHGALNMVKAGETNLLSTGEGEADAPEITAQMNTLLKYKTYHEKISGILTQYKSLVFKTSLALTDIGEAIPLTDEIIAAKFQSLGNPLQAGFGVTPTSQQTPPSRTWDPNIR